MNGVGIVQKAKYLDKFFRQIDNLLCPNGQAFVHSSDLKYLYEDNGNFVLPQNDYYGDVKFYVSYKGDVESFDWTYVDEITLTSFARQNGFKAQKITESEYGDFLMQIRR